jgi:hypothetical protein
MADTAKQFSEYDDVQILQKAYNPKDATLAVGGFLTGKVGHKVIRTAVSSTVDDFTYYDGVVLLYTLRITYDDASHSNVNQAERIV